MADLHIVDNTPCPCILWSLSGRDPREFHDARKEIERKKKGAKNGPTSISNK